MTTARDAEASTTTERHEAMSQRARDDWFRDEGWRIYAEPYGTEAFMDHRMWGGVG